MDNIPPSTHYSFHDINNNNDDDDGNNNNNNNSNPFDIPQRINQDMVAAPTSSQLPPSNPTSRDANVAKRYRPAPAKTFQCRGYGDCHMVFSRSEHLARHIRKHTGERPFTCHCGKQFSRLDNLRQHAQTVHSDKQEENERMMRDLTALHTSMTAAHKAANTRGKRAQQQHQQQQQQQLQHASASASSAGVVTTSANAAAAAAAAAAAQLGMGGMNNGVKVEELQMHRSLSSANNYGQQRPGTSVGYDVGPDSTGPAPSFGHRAWQLDTTGANNPPPGAHLAGSRPYHAQEQLQLQPGQHQHQQRMPGVSAYPAHHPADGHSFRDSHQSFRSSAAAAAATTTVQSPQSAGAQYQYGQQFQQQSQQYPPGQSFLASQSFLPSPAELASGRPSSSRSRPPTSGGPDAGTTVSATAAPRTTLPPLHSVVPQSIAAPGRQPSVLQLPPGSAGTGASRRPGTAPATYAYLPHRSSFGSTGRSAAAASITGSGLGTVPELSVYGGSSELGGPGVASSAHEFARFGQREYAHVGYPPSPPDGYGSGANDSPFSFHPPSLGDSGAPTATAAGTSRLRKRPYGGSESDDDDDDDDDRRSDRSFGAGGGISDDGDGEYDVAPPGSSAGAAARPPPTPSTAAGERHAEQFDYNGSGSRPQSRRLSVMELCNDPDAPGSTFLPISASRPATASGRFEFASPGAAAALAESDAAAATIPIKTIPAPSSSSAITATAVSSATATAAAGTRGSSSSPGGSASGSSPFAYGLDSGPGGSGGGLHPAVRRHGAGASPSGSTAAAAATTSAATPTASVLPRSGQQQQQFQRTTSPRSPVSYGRGSPSSASAAGSRSSRTGSPAYAYVGDSSSVQQQQQQQQSASPPSAASVVRDQVRVSVSPRGSTATPTGVRV
ncbi:USV1 [Sanghuangporus sanghuang]